MSADQTVTPQPRPTEEPTKLDDYPRRDRRRFDNSGPDRLSQDEARSRRLAGYGFKLTPDFRLDAEVEAIVRPVSGRVTHALTSRAYSNGTRDRIENYVDRLVDTVQTGVAAVSKPLALAVPAKLPRFDGDYLNTSEHTLVSLLTAHAALVTPALSAKLARHTPHDIELAVWSPPGPVNNVADRTLGKLIPVLHTMVTDLDRDVRSLRLYLARLDKLAAPLGGRR
jgi:hypothetical protein